MNFSIYIFANLCRIMYHLGVVVWLCGEDLKIDGSNFPGWCLHLRNVLLPNDLLFMIEEPLAKDPGWHATAQDHDEYRGTHEIATEVKTLMATSMEPRPRVHLVDEFECEITNEIGKYVLLQSLPPSYSAFVGSCVIGENQPIMHTTRKTLMQIVKMGRSMCVTCLGSNQNTHSSQTVVQLLFTI
jgi:hypothetical protein